MRLAKIALDLGCPTAAEVRDRVGKLGDTIYARYLLRRANETAYD